VTKVIYVGVIFTLLFSEAIFAETEFTIEGEKGRLVKEMTGLGIPWGIEFISDNELLVTNRKGSLSLINLKPKKRTAISGLPEIKVGGQGGLLDVRLSPNFNNNREVYLSYSKAVDRFKTTALAMAKLEENKLTEVRDVFVAKTDSKKGVHFGSRITFDDSYLYISVGDRGHRDRAQMLDYHNGKVIRLNYDGTVPKDNPFIGREEALPEIYSYGHRNPQGLFYDPIEKVLWGGEHGPRGGDEINSIEAGKNYGWPVITYGAEYYGPKIGNTHNPGMEQPDYYYVPSIAPSGMMVYSGKLFEGLKGYIFQGALKLQHLNIVFDGPGGKMTEKRLFQDIGRVRSVAESPSGDIFFGTDSGDLYRLTK